MVVTEDERRTFYNSMKWRRMRDYIRRRDNYECQWCKKKGLLTIDTGALNRNGRKRNALIVHHIEELTDRPELRLAPDNLVLICFRCHEQHHERWIENNKPKKNKWSHDEMW